MPAELACFEERCRARFAITEILYNCPQCGGLLEAVYGKPAQSAAELKALVARAPHAPMRRSTRAASGATASSFRSWTTSRAW